MFFSCSGQHLALQTASLVIKIVDQNAICVLSAGFQRMGTFCKSQQHLCHWVLLVQKETQHCNSEPKSIVLEMTNVGHDYFNLWVCVLATSLPLPCTICLTVTILTLTVTHHSWSACLHNAIPTTPAVIVPRTPWGAQHSIYFEAWFNGAVPVYRLPSILRGQTQHQRWKGMSSGSSSLWGWISHTCQTLQPLPRLNKPSHLKDCHQA